jgi:hypothetical protein
MEENSRERRFKMIKSILFFMLTVMMLSGSNVLAQESKSQESKTQNSKTQGSKTQNSNSKNKNFGLGFILGEPTGLSIKKWIGSNIAIDGAAAWSFGRKNSLQLHADCLFHIFNLVKVEELKFPLYYGIGSRVKFNDDTRVGIRFPLGINYIFDKAPVDIFLEVVPILNVAPATEFDLNGAVGVRYYFW